MPVAYDIRHRLAQARAAAGLSQRALAEKSGVSQGEIAHYETGRRTARGDNVTRLATALGRSTEWLAGADTSEAPPLGGILDALGRIEAQNARIERKLDALVALDISGDVDRGEERLPIQDRADRVVDAVARGSRAAQRTRAPQSPRASQRTTR